MKVKLTQKQIIIFAVSIIVLVAIVVILPQTKKSDTQNTKDEVVTNQNSITNTPEESADDSNRKETRNISIYSVDRDLREIIKKYAEEHWDFSYNINFYSAEVVYSTNDIIELASDKLVNDPSSLDMYCVPAYAHNFINGDLSKYASTYKELGIDIDTALEKADIPQYVIDNGSNQEGEIVALPYLSTVSVFVYRRSVAKEVWGTDEPDEITKIIGGGTESWKKFKNAALVLKDQGYYIVPGFKDLYSTSLSDPFRKEGFINPQWEEYMDLSKYLYDNGCIKDTVAWTDQWYKDLNGVGDKIFGYETFTDIYQYLVSDTTADDWAICKPPDNIVNNYNTGLLVNKNSTNKDILGPLIEWISLDSSETGLQYRLATGTFDKDEKLSVISGTVLRSADSSRNFLGGQNINPFVYQISSKPTGQYGITDETLNLYHWDEAMKAYLWGGKDKETVIEEFKIAVSSKH